MIDKVKAVIGGIVDKVKAVACKVKLVVKGIIRKVKAIVAIIKGD